MQMRFEPESSTAHWNTESPDRRTVLTGIGLAAAASAVTSAVSAAPANPPVSNVPVWKNEYVAMKGDVKIQLYRRRMKAPVSGETPLPILIMVHGSSMSALP